VRCGYGTGAVRYVNVLLLPTVYSMQAYQLYTITQLRVFAVHNAGDKCPTHQPLAMWCEPCPAQLPQVTRSYHRWHGVNPAHAPVTDNMGSCEKSCVARRTSHLVSLTDYSSQETLKNTFPRANVSATIQLPSSVQYGIQLHRNALGYDTTTDGTHKNAL